MTYFKNSWLLQWTVTGLLLGIGFVIPVVWFLGIAGIGSTIYLALRQSELKHVVLGSLLAWTTKSALSLVWFWSVYPIEWIGIDLGYIQLILIFFWWSTAALWLGSAGIVFAIGCRLLQKHTSLVVTYLSIPFLWIASEMFGSLIFSIITIGPGGSVTTAFSFGYVGYLLAAHPLLIQAAQIAGVYSLGVLMVAISVMVLYVLSLKLNKGYIVALLVLVFITSFISLPDSSPTKDPYTVAVVDTDFKLDQLRTSTGREQAQAQLEFAVQTALGMEPNYIVLPEDSRYFDQQSKPSLVAAQFAFRSGGAETVIVDSGRADDDEKAVIQSFVYNGQESIIDQSHKRYLVPQGEFMPTLYMKVLKLFGRDEVVDQFAKTVAFAVGSNIDQSGHADSSPGMLFCFESVSPWGVRTVLSERGSVPFIAHPVSHAWFNEPYSLWSQLTSMLRVQAIWNQQYIVSAGNGVSSQVFTPTGEVSVPDIVTDGDGWQLRITEIPR